jgi:hypothetical protein
LLKEGVMSSPSDAPSRPPSDAPTAAPPDDGGGQGSFTLPQDTLQVAKGDRERGSPPVSYFPPRELDYMSGRRADVTLFSAMTVIVIVQVAAFVYAC